MDAKIAKRLWHLDYAETIKYVMSRPLKKITSKDFQGYPER